MMKPLTKRILYAIIYCEIILVLTTLFLCWVEHIQWPSKASYNVIWITLTIGICGPLLGLLIVKLIYPKLSNEGPQIFESTIAPINELQEIQIQYELNDSDIEAFHMSLGPNAQQIKHNKQVLYRFTFIPIIIMAAFTIFALYYFRGNQLVFYGSICLIILCVLLLLLRFLSPLLLKFFVRYIVRTRFSKGKNKQTGQHKLCISAKGIKDTIDTRESMTGWDEVKYIYSDGKYIFLPTRNFHAFIIPKAVFTDDASFQQFINTTTAFHNAARKD